MVSWLWLGTRHAWAEEPAPAVVFAVQQDGGYLVTTSCYQARIGNDGNLHSLRVNGVEFLDDQTASSLGASFFVDHPLLLSKISQRAQDLTATDGVYTIRYHFEEGYVELRLRHENPTGVTFLAVCAPKVAYVQNSDVETFATAPADYNWTNVRVTMPTGEYLEFQGGTRIWGREINRQVWECDHLPAKSDHLIRLIPGRGAPPAPSLGQLTSLSVTMNHAEQLIPAGEPAVVQVHFTNNSNQIVSTDMAMQVASSIGKVLLDEHKPVVAPPHQTMDLPWSVTPGAPDYYTLTCSVNLDGTAKTLRTTFGYNIAAITAPITRPTDFAQYWAGVQLEAKAADVKLSMLEDAEDSTGTVKVYEAHMQAGGVAFAGWLAIPRYPGRYPGLLILPSDRVRNILPNTALADCGFVVLSIEPTGQDIRPTLRPEINYAMANLTNAATFGMRTMIVRSLCAVTALASVPEVDANRLAVTGAGLGGGEAIILAALDDRIQAVAPDVPFFCQVSAGSDRADWPYLNASGYLQQHPRDHDAVFSTLQYVDVANFADRVTCPALVSIGLNDDYARPMNVTGVVNLFAGPHTLDVYLAGHEGGGIKHWEEKLRWLIKVLGGPSPLAPALSPTDTAPVAVPPPVKAPTL
jgi:cephalosporin-C deacetylase